MLQLFDELKPLNQQDKAFFCLLTIERAIPAYKKFAGANHIQQSLESLIEGLYRSIIENFVLDTRQGLETLNNLTPDSEDYGDALSDQAQCITIALIYILQFLDDNDESNLEYSIQKMDEFIDIYETENPHNPDSRNRDLIWQRDLAKTMQSSQGMGIPEYDRLRERNSEHPLPIC